MNGAPPPWWREPTRRQWSCFLAAWAGWVVDAFDFTVYLLVAAHVADEFGVSLFGNQGGAEIHVKDYALTGTLRVFGDFEGIPTDSAPRLQKTHGHSEIIRGFVGAILDGTPVSPSGEEGLDRTRLIDAIYRSAELGREVELSAVSLQPAASAAAG